MVGGKDETPEAGAGLGQWWPHRGSWISGRMPNHRRRRPRGSPWSRYRLFQCRLQCAGAG